MGHEDEGQGGKEVNEKQDFIKAVARQEQILQEMKEIEERNQQLVARNLLGGKSEAGQTEPEKKEETPTEYRKRMVGY